MNVTSTMTIEILTGPVRELEITTCGDEVRVRGSCLGESGGHQIPFDIWIQKPGHGSNFFRCPVCTGEIEVTRKIRPLAEELLSLIQQSQRAIVVIGPKVFVTIPLHQTPPLPEDNRHEGVLICKDDENTLHDLTQVPVRNALFAMGQPGLLLVAKIDGSWYLIQL